MNIPDFEFDGVNRSLDVGGWFKPETRATHVVDLMPWETRGGKLNLSRGPDERFEKKTWFQVDFLADDFSLPFDDKYFDFVTCGHTIEDLSEPRKILSEMQRVAARGVIECPSRLTEQTVGMRDRETRKPGHPHHHWIVDSFDGRLMLYSKIDSGLNDRRSLLPLLYTERQTHARHNDSNVYHKWQNTIDFQIVTGPECHRFAQEFVKSQKLYPGDWAKDCALRFLRRTRSRLRQFKATDTESWWDKIVALSKPYSAIELK